jgi:hypothetical protein
VLTGSLRRRKAGGRPLRISRSLVIGVFGHRQFSGNLSLSSLASLCTSVVSLNSRNVVLYDGVTEVPGQRTATESVRLHLRDCFYVESSWVGALTEGIGRTLILH